MNSTTRSESLFESAKQRLVGGVNSPVRAFGRVGGSPIFFKAGRGPYLIDEDDNQYIDYVGSWGPAIVGHAHPTVIAQIKDAVERGLGFGAPTALETRIADKIADLMPAIEMVRMVNSGTEATMSAIRAARGFTGRDKIIKFEGCYHGHCDALLVKAGSGALTLGEPDSLGVPASYAEHTITLTFNDVDQVRQVFADLGDQIAAVIVEPVAGNMSCVPPTPAFLPALREVCSEHRSVLIFDEVMTGFRVALGGAQALYDVTPDLTTLGKVIGGGMPVGAYGGRADIMSVVAPLGGVYQAGTLSGNPVAMTAGLATLELISEAGFYENLASAANRLMDGFESGAARHGIAVTSNRVGGMFGFFFASGTVDSFDAVMNANTDQFNVFFRSMLADGVNLAPSPFESGFVSSAHTNSDLDQTIEAASRAFEKIAAA